LLSLFVGLATGFLPALFKSKKRSLAL
jgi:hypothetical protein